MGLGRGDLSGGESMSTSTSTSSSEASLPRRFPLAAQPEIMRAAEKDDQYASFVYDACRDAFRHLFGTRVAVAYQREVIFNSQSFSFQTSSKSFQNSQVL
ncbi:peroxisome biogenesis factor 10-like [Quercus robur]|uniref:peroxisome biogenesis factor 10-like n=1 Tax=Quercus robur TaxID=38942 RepID=UPI002161E4E8|nr:peroxisome biogenesis factor 10-like [Quercus robur]